MHMLIGQQCQHLYYSFLFQCNILFFFFYFFFFYYSDPINRVILDPSFIIIIYFYFILFFFFFGGGGGGGGFRTVGLFICLSAKQLISEVRRRNIRDTTASCSGRVRK